jgi:hypothetical protein
MQVNPLFQRKRLGDISHGDCKAFGQQISDILSIDRSSGNHGTKAENPHAIDVHYASNLKYPGEYKGVKVRAARL